MKMFSALLRGGPAHGFVGLVLLGLVLGVLPAAAQRTFEVYALGQSDPSSAQAAIQELLGEGERVIADPRNARLLVLADPQTHARIGMLMRTLNVAARNVRIEVEFDDRSSSREVGAGLTGGGRIVIPSGGKPESDFRVGLHARHQEDQSASRTVQTLLVASGREAVLRVGERIPHTEWFMDYGRRHGFLRGEIVWQDVGSHLVVLPVVIGDGPDIRIRLVPELSGRMNGEPFRLRYASAATDVIVRSGQTVSIGGLSQHQDFYSRFLFGSGRSGVTRALDIRLTPTLSGP